jgi:hypothetical protein
MNGDNIPALSVIMRVGDDTVQSAPRQSAALHLAGQQQAALQLSATIRAIRQQSFADFEFLILADDPTPDMGKVILGHALDDRRIRMITAEHCGAGYDGLAGLNFLHDVARAPFIARADATDISAPDRLERQMAVLTANPDHGVIGTGCNHRTVQNKGLVRRDPANPEPALPEFAWPEPPQPPLGDARIRASLEAGPPMDCATLIYAREAVLAAGGYRADFGHAAGFDLLLRLSSRTRMAMLPEALVSREQPAERDESEIVARASQNAIAWLCHRERLASRLDPAKALGRLPTVTELDMLYGRGTGDVVRRRVVEASLYVPQVLATEGWDMLKTYARHHQNDPRMWQLAGRMLAAGKPLRAGQLGMALISA